jgi:hypothetical protein
MLSDACHEFLGAIGTAAVMLQAAVEHYAEPPFYYPMEVVVISGAPVRLSCPRSPTHRGNRTPCLYWSRLRTRR